MWHPPHYPFSWPTATKAKQHKEVFFFFFFPIITITMRDLRKPSGRVGERTLKKKQQVKWDIRQGTKCATKLLYDHPPHFHGNRWLSFFSIPSDRCIESILLRIVLENDLVRNSWANIWERNSGGKLFLIAGTECLGTDINERGGHDCKGRVTCTWLINTFCPKWPY